MYRYVISHSTIFDLCVYFTSLTEFHLNSSIKFRHLVEVCDYPVALHCISYYRNALHLRKNGLVDR